MAKVVARVKARLATPPPDLAALLRTLAARDEPTTPLRWIRASLGNVMQMIAVAEESNTLDSVLNEISDGLERRTWRQLDLLVRMLEPIMLLLLAGAILIVVIALLVPVLKMATTI